MSTSLRAPRPSLGPRERPLVVLLVSLVGACTGGPTPRPTQSEATESPTRANAPPEESAVTDPLVPPPPEGVPPAGAPLPLPEPDPAEADETSVAFVGVVRRSPPPSPPDPLAEPAGAVPDAQFVGRFRISGSLPSQGGAIGWMREYELRADHTFQMSAYPPLAAGGTWRRVGTEGARAELVHDTLRAPDGSPRVEPVRGLALPGEPLSVLEVGHERYPRVVETP